MRLLANIKRNKILWCRHLRLSADLNNMSWRIRPEELLLEVGKQFSSKINLQQAMADTNVNITLQFQITTITHSIIYQLYFIS